MHSFFLLSAAAAITFASPLPQGLDLGLYNTLPTPQNVTVPSDVTSQAVTYDVNAAIDTIQAAVLSSDPSVNISDSTANATTTNAGTVSKRSNTCVAQPLGAGPVPKPDTPQAFLAYKAFASTASSAPVPKGYSQAFKNLQASNNAYGYLGFTNLQSYDTNLCASKCNAIEGCASFNIYYERDPTVDPATTCSNKNPASTTNIKCVFWGGPVSSTNANNAGQWRNQFQVVIAGSNGYVNKTIDTAAGFNAPDYYGNKAIDAPVDCNGQSTYLGSQLFSGGPFDARLCAAACEAKSVSNLANNLQTCKFFNTYILSRNGVAIGQLCNMYSQPWSSQYATYSGATTGSDTYSVSYSYAFAVTGSSATCVKAATTTYPVVTTTPTATGAPTTSGGFINWRNFKANGANLGAWMEKEQNYDYDWWSAIANVSTTPDEWSLCVELGEQCGPLFEEHYGSFVTLKDIDKLASVGVNLLRIPMTYAAFVQVPGSQLYHGTQLQYLKTITDYAVRKHGMHIILGLHSLPGGMNNLGIGEAFFHDAWYYNQTYLDYSYQSINGILDFIKANGNLTAFSIAPLNEASDNLALFATPEGLSAKAADWVSVYLHGCLDLIGKVDSRIPMVVQDSFKGAEFWSNYFDASANIVMDLHVYYFATGSYPAYVHGAICGQAAYIGGFNKFPNFIGEWSLGLTYNNTLSDRTRLFNTQRSAWSTYASGGAFWNIRDQSTTPLAGEGVEKDYWSYVDLIDEGVIKTNDGTVYC